MRLMRGDLAFRILVLLFERVGDGRRQAAILIGLVCLRFRIGIRRRKQIFGNGRALDRSGNRHSVLHIRIDRRDLGVTRRAALAEKRGNGNAVGAEIGELLRLGLEHKQLMMAQLNPVLRLELVQDVLSENVLLAQTLAMSSQIVEKRQGANHTQPATA